MRYLRVLLLAVACVAARESFEDFLIIGDSTEIQDDCSREVIFTFRNTLDIFAGKMIKAATKIYEGQFIVSAYSAYMMLAAIAEGATGATRDELYKVLELPKLKCHRDEYYKYAMELEPDASTTDVTFTKARLFALDKTLTLNETWAEEMRHSGLLNAISIPMKDDPSQATTTLKQLFKYWENLRFQGNSMLIDSLDYKALWKTSFPEAKIEKNAPFYGEQGQLMMPVDMLRFKKRVKMGLLETYHVKYLVLPVGSQDQYTMIYFLKTNDEPIQKFVEKMPETFALDVLHGLYVTLFPIDIAVPEITFRSKHDDMHLVFQEMGIKSLWNDPSGTSLISDPPAAPTEFVQNVVMHLERYGVEEIKESETTSLISEISLIHSADEKPDDRTFIANKPFLFTLVNNNHRVVVLSGIYSGEHILID